MFRKLRYAPNAVRVRKVQWLWICRSQQVFSGKRVIPNSHERESVLVAGNIVSPSQGVAGGGRMARLRRWCFGWRSVPELGRIHARATVHKASGPIAGNAGSAPVQPRVSSVPRSVLRRIPPDQRAPDRQSPRPRRLHGSAGRILPPAPPEHRPLPCHQAWS